MKYELKDLKFSFDLSKTNYEMDVLQNRMLEFYLRADPRFRRAFSMNYTSDFLQFIKDKAKLKEPYHLSVMGNVRCQAKGSKVLMSNGEWKNIEEIKIGDKVISPQKNGKNIFTKVTDTFHYKDIEIYNIKERNRKKSLLYSCSFNHEIPIFHLKKLRNKNVRKGKWILIEQTAEELSKYSESIMKSCKIAFSSFPIEKFENRKNCDIEPYTLGVFLGDGHFSSKNLLISNSKSEVLEEVSRHYFIRDIKKRKAKTLKYSVQWWYSINGEFYKLLKKYGLMDKKSGKKFIPKEALFSDINYRKKLLAGLIDTDGYLSKSSSYSITTKSKQLAKDIVFLIHSLGGRTSIHKVIKGIKKTGFEGKYYQVNFYLGNFKLPILVKYKKKKEIKSPYLLTPNRISIKSSKFKKGNVYGFTLDSDSHYYITDNFMITKNSGKSYVSISLAVLSMALQGKVFTKDYICGNAYEFVERLKYMPEEDLKNSTFLIDEEKGAVFGIGSVAKKMKIKDVQNIIAINNISTIFLTPMGWQNRDAMYGARTFGRCFNTKTVRLMLYNLQERGKGGELPMGCLYLPIFTSFLPKDYADELEKDYLDMKMNWVKNEMRGENDALGIIKRKSAELFLKDEVYDKIPTKKDKLAYISQKLGSEYTKNEIDEIQSIINLLKEGFIEEE